MWEWLKNSMISMSGKTKWKQKKMESSKVEKYLKWNEYSLARHQRLKMAKTKNGWNWQ